MGRWHDILTKQAVKVDPLEPWQQRPVSHTVGRLGAPLTSLITGSMDPMRLGSLDPKEVQKLVDKHKSKLDHDDFELKVNLGASRPWDNLKRIWKNPRTSTLSKLLSTAVHPQVEIMSALNRSDHYNPFAHSISLYSPSKEILRHELGHAEDFKNREYPGAYAAAYSMLPFFKLYPEALASRYAAVNAAADGVSEEDMKKLNRMMGGAYGTYLANEFIPGAGIAGSLLTAGGGQAIGYFAQPFGKRDSGISSGNKPSQKAKEVKVTQLPQPGSRKAAAEKTAGPESDYISAAIGPRLADALLPGVGSTVGLGGHLYGLLDDQADDPESDLPSIIPGVGGYRVGRRMRTTSDEFDKDREEKGLGRKLWSEYLGPSTSMLASALAGAGIGAGIGASREVGGDRTRLSNALSGAAVGGAVGGGISGLGSLLGLAGAAATPTRTKDEQREYETDRWGSLRNYLIPGSALYNSFKRLGYSRNHD